MAITLTDCIERSILRNEIVTEDLSFFLPRYRDEADAAGDDAGRDLADSLIEMLDNTHPDDVEISKGLRAIVRCLIDTAQMDHRDCDDVENGTEWEMWGTVVDEDGEDVGDYRVHISINR